MSADQVAEIAPFVREVLDGEAYPEVGSITRWRATLEVSGNPNAWVQFMQHTLTFAYPTSARPEEHLQAVLASLEGCAVASWEPMKCATLTFRGSEVYRVSRAIDALLERLFALGDYSVDGKLERVPHAIDRA